MGSSRFREASPFRSRGVSPSCRGNGGHLILLRVFWRNLEFLNLPGRGLSHHTRRSHHRDLWLGALAPLLGADSPATFILGWGSLKRSKSGLKMHLPPGKFFSSLNVPVPSISVLEAVDWLLIIVARPFASSVLRLSKFFKSFQNCFYPLPTSSNSPRKPREHYTS